MKQVRFALLSMMVVVAAVALGWVVGEWRKPRAAPSTASGTVDRGPMLYQVYCASCHGPDGHGNGMAAAALKPPPRDFALRPWRFQPTLESIRNVTRDGIPGTAMASFGNALSGGDFAAVTAHVHSLASANPGVFAPVSEEERLLADAGFTSLRGTKPPPITLAGRNETTVKLSDFSGQTVILHFWGTGCTHCIKEIPVFNELEKKHPGRLKVLHICTDVEDVASAQSVLEKLTPGTEAFVEADGIGLARYGIQSLPTVWLIAPDGTAIGRTTGAKNWSSAPVSQLITHWIGGQK